MVRELSWYLESGRFSSLVEELEGSLKKYEAAKKEGCKENALSPLRENTRALFEDQCVRSGLREDKASFVNIDAEFFNGNALDETAVNTFMKNIIKGHCYQKVLWTYMGTTGSFSPVSKAEMSNQGLRYDDYLPIEYKKNRSAKKPLEDTLGKGTELFYMYGNGTVGKEYNPEKARLAFNRLEDKSGIDWKTGYDPNGSIKKDGWHGAYNHNGIWAKVEDAKRDANPANQPGMVPIELIRHGDVAILHDPGMLLLSSPLLVYFTESGEPYGNLEMDREGTVKEIRETLEKMGVKRIGVIGGIAPDNPEILSSYREILKDLAAPDLAAVDRKAVRAIKEGYGQAAAEKVSEEMGVRLEKKLKIAGKYGVDTAMILESIVHGSLMVPLSPRNKADGLALGLSEVEVDAVCALPLRPEDEAAYDTVLSNLYAAWPYFQGGISRVEAAGMVYDYFLGKDITPVIAAETSLGAIIRGEGETAQEGVRTYASGIPGEFSEPPAVDFYNEAAKGKFLKSLERKRALPKGGAAAASAALKAMPEGAAEKRAELNRGLARALGQYKEISMSTGIPLAELVEAVKAEAGFGGGKEQAVFGRKVYYEIPTGALIAEAKKENRQKKEVRLDNETDHGAENTVIIGGVQGPALDEVLLTREKLIADYAFSEEEAGRAQPFLHGIRFYSQGAEGLDLAGKNAITAILGDAVRQDAGKTAAGLRRGILGALDGHTEVSYNLASDEGMQAYYESGRGRANKVGRKDLEAVMQEARKSTISIPLPPSLVSMVSPKYRAEGNVPLQRNVSKGKPGKIYPYPVNIAGEPHIPEASFQSHNGGNTLMEAPLLEGQRIKTGTGGIPDFPFSAMPEQNITENVNPLMPEFALHSQKNQPGNAETERLRKIEASYERDMEAPLLESQYIKTGAGAIPDFPFSAMTEQNITENVNPSVPEFALHSQKNQPGNAELERLRKIEANYERDKAMLARQKQPALARSESHDVGHAEGEGETIDSPEKTANAIYKDIAWILQRDNQ
ncbi:MAG: hypothetical protein LBI14_00375 [Treponema sp.]|jgi:hypothetical protein|nr:hypothetical protein [Treponema sp.]